MRWNKTANREIIVAGAGNNLGAGGGFDGWVVVLDGTGNVILDQRYARAN